MNDTVLLDNSKNISKINSVLVVDDNKTIQETMSFILEGLGRKVWSANNGEEAIKKYQKCKPDLVFMDIRMPKMSGVEAISEIKKMDDKANIVIVTAFSGDNDVMKLVKTDSIKIIDKPFELAEIKKCL